MNKLIKKLSYLVFSLLGLLAPFFAYSLVSAKAASDSLVAKATAEAATAGLKASGRDSLTFFEYIGDFCGDIKATTAISAIFAFIAILCVGVMIFTVILSLISKEENTLEKLHIKWVSVAAFAACLISLMMALIFPDFPKVEGVKFSATIGIGSILMLVATGLSAIFSFVAPKLLKD